MKFTSSYADPQIRCVDRIDVDALPPGRRTRLVVEMTHDALGRAQRVPVIAIRGTKPGPTLGLTCALHGNELNGIPVVHKLLSSVDPETLRGTLIAAPVLNIPGYLENQRRYRDDVDLNHIMPGVEDGNESDAYAFRIAERLVNAFDVMIDLHTASFGRINSLYVRADMSDPHTARIAYLQRPQIILHNPPSDFTLRGMVAERGARAITVEVGDPQVFQPKHIKPTLAGVRAVMADLRMSPRRKRSVTTVAEPIVCGESTWLYTRNGGLLTVLPDVGAPVSQGELIAVQTDIFGDVVAEYTAPFAGVIIGKSVNPVSPTGARIVHLGRVARPQDNLCTAADAEEATE